MRDSKPIGSSGKTFYENYREGLEEKNRSGTSDSDTSDKTLLDLSLNSNYERSNSLYTDRYNYSPNTLNDLFSRINEIEKLFEDGDKEMKTLSIESQEYSKNNLILEKKIFINRI